MKDWRERFPEIHAEDRAFWSRRGFEEVESERGEVSFRGAISVRRGGHPRRDFELQFDYPPGFPHYQPTVRFIHPQVRNARHQAPGRHGAPCLFPPAAWQRGLRAGDLYAATERWLGYHLDKRFPRELAIYELPEYFERAFYSVLVPPGATASFAERPRGKLKLTELRGHPIWVLRSVDGERVGESLLSALAEPGMRGDEKIAKWYRLRQEPEPFSDTKRLTEILEESGHQVSFRDRPSLGLDPIALVFEDKVFGKPRILVVDIAVKSKKAVRKVGKGWPVCAPALHVVSRANLQSRLEHVRPLDRLAAKTVVCFGLGAIGSTLALSLGREGVGSFVLCDPDALRPGNVVRHALDLTSVGELKAEALDTALGRINPEVDASPQHQNLGDPRVIATNLRDADLVVAAVGEESREELICEVAAAREDPPAVLLVRTLHAGDAFRVVLIRPGVDACFQCLGEYKADREEGWINVPRAELPEVREEGCATAALPGAGLGFQHAASFAAARALDFLEGRETGANHWLWVERPIASADPRLGEGLVLHRATFAPRPGCPVCGD